MFILKVAVFALIIVSFCLLFQDTYGDLKIEAFANLRPCGPNEQRYIYNCTNACTEISCRQTRHPQKIICLYQCRLYDLKCYCSSGFYRLGDRCVTYNECPP